MIQWSREIALGMIWISDAGIIHRDLAARNCLLDEHYRIKIADLGLARLQDTNSKAYVPMHTKIKSGKWTALEALLNDIFTVSSDVWSYGVTIWEIFSYGAEPYENMDGQKLMSHLLEGKRLPKPSDCLDNVYHLMQKCWHQKPEFRPSFNQISAMLQEIFI